jgi:cbb3-type cytochrome oxidase subunit 1
MDTNTKAVVTEKFSYDDAITKMFLLATIVWGVVALT